MDNSTRNVRSTNNRSLLLKLYQELEKNKDTSKENQIQNCINQIIAENYLHYVNR